MSAPSCQRVGVRSCGRHASGPDVLSSPRRDPESPPRSGGPGVRDGCRGRHDLGVTLDAALACRHLGGSATTRELRAMGVPRRRIEHAIAAGTLVRPRRGCYALPSLPTEALAALAHGGPLCCAAALRVQGVWLLEPDDAVHVWLGPNGRQHGHPGCTCRVHRDRSRHDRADAGGWRVPLVQALAQLLGCLGQETFFAALESALRKRLLTRSDVGALRAMIPAIHRWLVDFARGDADSGLESLIRLRLHRIGVDVVTQVRIPGVGRVDFVIGDRLIVEADGETHGGADNRHRDLMRDACAAALGFVTLRFTYAQIVHDWAIVEAAIVTCVAQGVHRSPAGRRREASVRLV